ncbi:hypothetical protein [Flavobacterium aquatile]|uniref:Beta-lactamase-inhibitor-like PepSY-like domain-containing protein n=1 Tax=Flavobacterium aquatile LMG 4008 = ATCC 11947 TaxID=1453498 RepID=A0A095UWN9_9FLAO|nr:hypothetical protein [Flavobacterium aquatile]KGD66990.1 hypothetical protein LG45_16380 [Flavobacterium aquatile LMG 4008 = ATCC 11947]OXA68085.1 hypothetical protein B0A61_06350 [Flavobacterium aquatile LMG 4008 = ATCC 11947]GEC80166.1 hypothetical protein FAQ01_30360 [Flavobacterium aquatile]
MKTIFNKTGILFSLLIAGILVSNVSFAQQKDLTKELDILFTGFKNQDYETLKPLLDDEVKISENIPLGMNDMVIPQVLAQIPVPDSYKVIKIEKIGDNQKITTEYFYKERDKRVQYFTFNSKGIVIDLDILSDATKVESSIGEK